MLLLLPNLLDTTQSGKEGFSLDVINAVATIDGLIAESEKEGRRFLKRFQLKKKPHEIPIALLNEHTRPDDYDFLLEPILKGETWGLISDCGLPSLADPGSALVFHANQLNIPIQAYPGPSSIIMGLMLSGFTGQRFAFHGYLAKDAPKKREELLLWQKRAQIEDETQIFIEAPYRNLAAFKFCLETLSPKILLCIASNLTAPNQLVKTMPISKWTKLENPPDIHDKPTIFLFK